MAILSSALLKDNKNPYGTESCLLVDDTPVEPYPYVSQQSHDVALIVIMSKAG